MFNKIASEIAKREGKKSQTHIGNIREILRILVEMDADSIMKHGDFSKSPISYLSNRTAKELEKRQKQEQRKAKRKKK